MKLPLGKWALLVLILLSLGASFDGLRGETAPVSIKLQPMQDTFIHQGIPGTNYGTKDYLQVMSYTSANARAFVMFNLSGIPPGAYVTRASLQLYLIQPPAVARIYRCSRANGEWSENGSATAEGITWNNQPSVDSAFSSVNATGTSPNVWLHWNVTYWVQRFLARDAETFSPNYGWSIRDDAEDAPPPNAYSSYFRSKESGDSSHRPILAITYYPPYLRLEAFAQAFTKTWVKLRVHRRDFRDRPISRGNLTVKLSSTSGSGSKKFSLTEGGPPINQLLIEDGATYKDFWYYDDIPGTWTIKAWTTDFPYYGEDFRWQTIVADTLPPTTNLTVGQPKVQIRGTLYITSKTAFSLTAKDNGSGVKSTWYRIDGSDWKNSSIGYSFNIVSKDGFHTVGYYSEDKLGNREAEKTFSVFLDDTAPSIRCLEPSGTLARKSTSVKFKVFSEDNGSGVTGVELIFDGISQGSMTKENNTYTKEIGVPAGTHRWRAKAVDNMGNAAETSNTEFVLVIDVEPPMMVNIAVFPESPVINEQIGISASVRDEISGVKEVILYYSTDGGSTWNKIAMNFQANLYQATIPAQGSALKVLYYIEAIDYFSNSAKSTTKEINVGFPIWMYAIPVAIIIAVIVAIIFARKKLRSMESQFPE